METNWATEHLQTIRTLMERSALYRRALAPITTFVGVVGIVAGIAGWQLNILDNGPFALYWMVVGVVAVFGALLLVRKQAIKQGEKIWSPPTRRVAQAMQPPLTAGLARGLFVMSYFYGENANLVSLLLILSWTFLYGFALHSAGFFMPRGIRVLGWAFIVAGIILMWRIFESRLVDWTFSLNLLMGLLFGASHLAYGIYLYFTERKNAA